MEADDSSPGTGATPDLEREDMGPPLMTSSNTTNVEQPGAGILEPSPLKTQSLSAPTPSSSLAPMSASASPPLRQPGTRLPLGFTPRPHYPRKGGPNPILHLEHLVESFVHIHRETNIFGYTHANQLLARQTVFKKSLELMEALTGARVRKRLKVLIDRKRAVEWQYANFAVEVVERVVARGKGLVVFREAVLGVGSLAGRLGVLSVLWDELREEGVRIEDVIVEMGAVDRLIRNGDGKAEGTVWGKVIPDLRVYLGVKEVLEGLTEALEMANGVGGVRQVITWDVMADEEGYIDE
ncbi:hypothetical protein FKW77_006080 [Venturia effusa]|uniref:Uncharacterized protein n=1 Tax=Venturia effusa TaxID=50376 RepID=A0A517L9F3_9PEZI|nr:hypothetical protein FKW77_006080 [Venturia effusa]